MVNNTILADLERALQLLKQVDEKDLDFFPDPNVSPDIIALTDITEYPTQTHIANLMARIDAVIKAGVKVIYPNKKKFQEATKAMYLNFKKDKSISNLIDRIINEAN